MTGDGSETPGQGPVGQVDERAARLQALLSVDLEDRAGEPERRRRPDPAGPPPPGAPTTPVPARVPWSPTSVVSALVLLALFAGGIGLTWAGAHTIRSSTEGEVVEPVDDPAAPGYEALVASTPTLAVLHDVGGDLDAVTVLTLPDPQRGGGGVVLVPTRVVDDLPLFGVAPLEAAYDLGSTPQVQAEMVGDLLTAGIDEVVVVDAARWEGLVAPVAPLVVDNPTDVEVEGDLRYAQGEVALAADEVGDYLEARGEEESDLARLYRHELVWRAWLDAVAEAGGGDAVPGELESGLGRFVRALAAGPTRLATLPVDRSSSTEFGDEPTYVPDVEAIAALVAEVIPFPRSPRPGVRERVRILSGTPDLEAARRLAPELPPLGLEVVIVGNAATLDHARSTIAYVAPPHEEAARDIRDLLGVGDVLADPRPTDVVDITVTLGSDHD